MLKLFLKFLIFNAFINICAGKKTIQNLNHYMLIFIIYQLFLLSLIPLPNITATRFENICSYK